MHRSFTLALFGIVLSGAFLMGSTLYTAQDQSPAPDNTRVNKSDRGNSQPTADQAKNNMSDRDLEKNIRREVVKDKSLSSYGHNVKIISQHGTVTLRGPVHSDDEKRAIEEHARKYAGDGHVNNELTVKGDRS
ncbi:MAG TPA: BON domain-containing protein [Bryobacteraceae bacterium]|jgi:osmotically-inducible protein OsmY|nr:BON domain-containing protein [Bryobacteraceae bacterium]